MNILTLINMRPRKLGTVEEYCLSLSEELTKRGHKSILGFIEYPPTWLYQMFNQRGAIVENINLNSSKWSQFLQIKNLVKKYRIDIIHSTFFDIFSLLTVLMKFSGVQKLIFSDQISRLPQGNFRLKRFVKILRNRAILHLVDLIIADAEFIKEDLINNSAVNSKKIKVLYNGVNTGRFLFPQIASIKKNHFGIPDNFRVVTTVSKCIPEKGVDVFLKAASKVLKSYPNVKFIIVGDGPILEDLKNLSSTLGIADATLFLGLRNDVHDVLMVSDIFVLCSIWQEAFAFSLLEAMASGCPVVASDIGAIPESVINGETGILVPPGDIEAVAAAINILLGDESVWQRMAHASRKRVVDNFSMNHWVNQTINLYEEILFS